MSDDASSMADVLHNVEQMRTNIQSVLKVVRIVREHMTKDSGQFLRIGDFVRDLRLVGASLRRLADMIDRETDKFLVS